MVCIVKRMRLEYDMIENEGIVYHKIKHDYLLLHYFISLQ